MEEQPGRQELNQRDKKKKKIKETPREEGDCWKEIRRMWLLIKPGDLGHMKVSGDLSQGLVVE